MILFIGTFLYLSFVLSIALFLGAILISSSENDTDGKNKVDNLLLASLIFITIYILGSVMLIIRIVVVALYDYSKNNKKNLSRVGSESLIHAGETPESLIFAGDSETQDFPKNTSISVNRGV